MIRGLLVCLALVYVASAQDAQNNTRIFGALGNLAGNLAGGALGALGGALGGAQQGFQQRPPHHHQQGFNPGLQQGFNPGFQQQGFNPGFQQQGFNPGFQQQGFNPGLQQQGFNPGFPQQGSSGSNSCRRWCRTPQGQAYCCETASDPIAAAIVKPGQCPPVRPQCPPTRFHNPPARCSSDGACGAHDKCCFDTCLQHHTCKPPIGLGK